MRIWIRLQKLVYYKFYGTMQTSSARWCLMGYNLSLILSTDESQTNAKDENTATLTQTEKL